MALDPILGRERLTFPAIARGIRRGTRTREERRRVAEGIADELKMKRGTERRLFVRRAVEGR